MRNPAGIHQLSSIELFDEETEDFGADAIELKMLGRLCLLLFEDHFEAR